MLDHFACSRMLCVNVQHLRPVTSRENVLRSETSLPAINRAKDECPAGHPYAGENLRVDPRTGRRICRSCARSRMAEARARRAPIHTLATMPNGDKTHCKTGHEFTEANTYRYGPDRQWRMCKTCARDRDRLRPSGSARSRKAAHA